MDPALRRPKHLAKRAFTCVICRVHFESALCYYDPRKSKRTTALVCEPCGRWLANFRPTGSNYPRQHSAWEQASFDALDPRSAPGTDPGVSKQKAG